MLEPPSSNRSTLRYVLETHGFGAFIALLLLAAYFGYLPTPLAQLAKHMERDANREGILLAVCLNTARDEAERARCWNALLDGRVSTGGK